MPQNVLDTAVKQLKGTGQKLEKNYAKLGIHNCWDLLRHFPRDYEDRTIIKTTGLLIHGESVCVAAEVVDMRESFGSKPLLRVRAADETGYLDISFFNMPYVKDNIKIGERYIFYGKAERETRIPRMVNPDYELQSAASSKTRRVNPIYPLTAGLRQWQVAMAMKNALILCKTALPDVTPRSVREAYGLAETAFAYENIHFPPDFESLSIARRRLMFDELFAIAVLTRKARLSRRVNNGRLFDCSSLEEFIGSLPFKLTEGQRSAISDCASDFISGHMMSRLIQGDVGCGKTIVAFACCHMAAKSGSQAALMAPTELLAEQHYRNALALLEPHGVRIALLTGSLTKKQRDNIRNGISIGEYDVVIGTHALISEGVEFFDLGLGIIDEQHRFGVNQRSRLAAMGENVHLLVMSATPIPRSLNLILTGDLDISEIRELPPGRKPVRTYIYEESKHEKLYKSIRNLVASGRQVYIICPAVEEDESTDPGGIRSAKAYARMLSESVFPDIPLGLVFGGMKPREKEIAMRSFSSGEIKILVATTVVEVGVDVPNAALIVVENADRFGLSQLHQLRGRVGRGQYDSFCVLLEGAGGETSRERLSALTETNDGFEIAERDLKLRGPGDFIGERQHGLPNAKFAGAYSDMSLIEAARSAAEKLLAADPEISSPENRGLRQYISREFESTEAALN